MSLTITPTVGRKVWYFENARQSEPIDATIIKVHVGEDHPELGPLSLVNLSARLPDSGTHRFVHAVQATEDPVDAPHYRWMPYQSNAAAKPDAADLATRIAAIEATLGIQSESPEGGLLIPDAHMAIVDLSARVDKIADYVGLPSAEELTAAQQWGTAVGQLGSAGDNGAASAGGVIVGAGAGSGSVVNPDGSASFQNSVMSINVREITEEPKPADQAGTSTQPSNDSAA